jgi:hypothetical protein
MGSRACVVKEMFLAFGSLFTEEYKILRPGYDKLRIDGIVIAS